jgi:hypothetical protein
MSCTRRFQNSKSNASNERLQRSPSRSLKDDFDSRDMQYSWMPVPERDGNLAIHAIPTAVKEGKSSNTVKFSKVDSYHEYRSRHKHTPPTKDTNSDRQPNKKVETVLIQNEESESVDYLDSHSDTSSVENMNLETKDGKLEQAVSDTEKIIIYKLLNSRMLKKQREYG